MDEAELWSWRDQLAEAAWADIIGDYVYADKLLVDITKRYVYGKAKREERTDPKQKAKGSRRSRSTFRRRNSSTD